LPNLTILSQDSSGGNEENHERRHSGYWVSGPRFEPESSRMLSRSVSHSTTMFGTASVRDNKLLAAFRSTVIAGALPEVKRLQKLLSGEVPCIMAVQSLLSNSEEKKEKLVRQCISCIKCPRMVTAETDGVVTLLSISHVSWSKQDQHPTRSSTVAAASGCLVSAFFSSGMQRSLYS
jgi:hypothetical protein